MEGACYFDFCRLCQDRTICSAGFSSKGTQEKSASRRKARTDSHKRNALPSTRSTFPTGGLLKPMISRIEVTKPDEFRCAGRASYRANGPTQQVSLWLGK